MSISTEKRQKPLQKLISFTEHEFDLIKKELSEGWRVVSSCSEWFSLCRCY